MCIQTTRSLCPLNSEVTGYGQLGYNSCGLSPSPRYYCVAGPGCIPLPSFSYPAVQSVLQCPPPPLTPVPVPPSSPCDRFVSIKPAKLSYCSQLAGGKSASRVVRYEVTRFCSARATQSVPGLPTNEPTGRLPQGRQKKQTTSPQLAARRLTALTDQALGAPAIRFDRCRVGLVYVLF